MSKLGAIIGGLFVLGGGALLLSRSSSTPAPPPPPGAPPSSPPAPDPSLHHWYVLDDAAVAANLTPGALFWVSAGQLSPPTQIVLQFVGVAVPGGTMLANDVIYQGRVPALASVQTPPIYFSAAQIGGLGDPSVVGKAGRA